MMTADPPAPPDDAADDPAALARQAAAAWGHPDPELRQVEFGATAVFRLDRGTGRPMALRLHPRSRRATGRGLARLAIPQPHVIPADAGISLTWSSTVPGLPARSRGC